MAYPSDDTFELSLDLTEPHAPRDLWCGQAFLNELNLVLSPHLPVAKLVLSMETRFATQLTFPIGDP